MKNKFLFIDVETPNSCQSSVCQIAAINDEIDLNELVDPCVKFDYFNKNFHGINEEKIYGKPNFKNAFLERINIVDNDYILIGHNISFDVYVIAKDALRYGVNIEKFNTICTKKLYENIFPDLGKYDLESLCNYFDIDLGKHHDAYNDALACKKLFENLVNGNHIQEPIELYVEEIYFDLTHKEIKYDNFSDTYILRVAIWIHVYLDLKQNGFISPYLDTRIKELYEEFDFLIYLSGNKLKNIKNYKDCIDNTKFSEKTINVIYLQIMLSYFACDNIIDEKETQYILKWLDSLKNHFKKEYPFNILTKKLDDALEDGIITNEESNEIILLINKTILMNEKKEPDNKIENKDVDFNKDENSFFDKLINKNELLNKTFCLTGDFVSFSSKDALSLLLKDKFEMIENKSVLKNTCFLIVGSLGSPKWAYGIYGTKITKAISLKEGNNISKIKIISEEELKKYLQF